MHPSYYSGGLFHDVAVLVLAEPVIYSANVLPICLPEQGTDFLTGTSCYGIGWGSDSFGEPRIKLTDLRLSFLSAYQNSYTIIVLGPEGRYQTELRKVNLPIVSQEDCQTRLRNTKLGQYFQ